MVGSIAALGTAKLASESRVWLASYAVASGGGVLLATARKEEPRLLPVLLGTALGAVPLLGLADEDTDAAYPVFAIGLITTPLFGALGQNW